MRTTIDPTRHVAYTDKYAYQLFYIRDSEGEMSEADNLVAVFRRLDDGWAPEMAIYFEPDEVDDGDATSAPGWDNLRSVVTPGENDDDDAVYAAAAAHLKAAYDAPLWVPNGVAAIYYIADDEDAEAAFSEISDRSYPPVSEPHHDDDKSSSTGSKAD